MLRKGFIIFAWLSVITMFWACSAGTQNKDMNSLCAEISHSLHGSEDFAVYCNVVDGENRLPALDDTGTKIMKARAACIQRNADDPVKLSQCFGLNQEEQEACEQGNKDEMCLNGVAVDCHDKTVSDCKAAGLVCVEIGQSEATCADGKCNKKSRGCKDQDTVVLCNGKVETHTSCKIRFDSGESLSVNTKTGESHSTMKVENGGVCNPDATSSSEPCIGTGEACDPNTFKARCEGTVSVTCVNKKVARVDCADLGFNCIETKPGEPICRMLDNECDLKTFAETCDHGRINYCLLGKIEVVDCKAAGFSGCEKSRAGHYYCN